MSDGKRKVLELLEAGEITREEAQRLLDALGESGGPADPASSAGKGIDKGFSLAMEEIREASGKEPREASGGTDVSQGPADRETPWNQSFFQVMDEVRQEVGAAAQEAAEALDQVAQEVLDGWRGVSGPEGSNGLETDSYPSPTLPAGLNAIETEWANGPVEVQLFQGDSIQVCEYSRRPLRLDQLLDLSVAGETLKIRWTKGNAFWKKLGLWKRLVIQIPTGQALERLRVQNTSGVVLIRGLSCANCSLETVSGQIQARESAGGRWNMSTVSGGVLLERINVKLLETHSISGRIDVTGTRAEQAGLTSISGQIRLENSSAKDLRIASTSGRVQALGFESQNAELSTTSGSLQAQGNGERLMLESHSGSVKCRLGQLPRQASLKSTSGKLSLSLPENTGFTLDYSSISSKLHCDFPCSGNPGQKEGQAVYGDGAGALRMETISGGMTLLRS